jgi:hypothetical protein
LASTCELAPTPFTSLPASNHTATSTQSPPVPTYTLSSDRVYHRAFFPNRQTTATPPTLRPAGANSATTSTRRRIPRLYTKMAGSRNYDFLVSWPYPRCCPAHQHSHGCWTLNAPPPPIHRPTLTLPRVDQTTPHRRLGRRQIVLSAALQRRLVHALVHHHHRHRLQDPHHRARRQAREAADMGYRRSRALPDHHHSLLQRCHGYPASIRRHG